VFVTTGGLFEVKSGQQKLTSSASINPPALALPDCSAKQGQAAYDGSAKVIL
jgi:type VI secretion system secreted protein VgrG